MKNYYRTTRTLSDGRTLKCFTPRFVKDLENMDIISSYTKEVEPSDGEYKNSPHILINISTDQYNKLKSIENDVNEKYFEMGGNNEYGWNDVSQMVLDIFEKGYREEVQYGDYREKQYEEVENEIKEEQERRIRTSLQEIY
jgi:hypothetical protein